MTYQKLIRQLTTVYDEGEAKAIARMVFEVRYGLSLSDLLLGKEAGIPEDELEAITQRLLQQEPVQYVLGETTFCGRTFHVEPGVLIPRPETEELCHWIIAADLHRQTRTVRNSLLSSAVHILDIGTGSGCIACTLALDIPQAQLTAWDISKEALNIAKGNAKALGADVTFEQVDILESWGQVHDSAASLNHTTCPRDSFDLIVSNPPYICNKERAMMEANVLEYEPHTALFVPDDDPLLFYRAIATYAQTALKPGGSLYFEFNPLYADTLYSLLRTMSYHGIEIKADQYGKQRMIKGIKM
jgi:release factor glutamine methyltransferase